jgi:hypothetical protein
VTGKNGQNNLLYLPLDKMIEGSQQCTGDRFGRRQQQAAARPQDCNSSRHVPGRAADEQ